MITLKDIFKIIEGREWDRFGWEDNLYPTEKDLGIWKNGEYRLSFSLADLLANKSWCEAVWSGKEGIRAWLCENKCEYHDGFDTKSIRHWHYSYHYHSSKAFEILQQEGVQEAIDYIYLTMKK